MPYINSLRLPAHLYIKNTMHPHDLDPVLVPGCTITRVEEVGGYIGHNTDLEVIYTWKVRPLKCEDPRYSSCCQRNFDYIIT